MSRRDRLRLESGWNQASELEQRESRSRNTDFMIVSKDGVSLCSPDWPEIHCVPEGGPVLMADFLGSLPCAMTHERYFKGKGLGLAVGSRALASGIWGILLLVGFQAKATTRGGLTSCYTVTK